MKFTRKEFQVRGTTSTSNCDTFAFFIVQFITKSKLFEAVTQ